MAIKIIKSEPAPEVLKQIVCKNCGVTLQYTPNDVESRNYKEIDGVLETCYWIDCPNCQESIYLSYWQVD